jgi:hypothetical protein
MKVNKKCGPLTNNSFPNGTSWKIKQSIASDTRKKISKFGI